MPNFLITWEAARTVKCWTHIEADSEEEALEIFHEDIKDPEDMEHEEETIKFSKPENIQVKLD